MAEETNGGGGLYLEWHGKRIGVRGIVGLIALFFIVLIGTVVGEFWLDRARAEEHDRLTLAVRTQVEEQRLTNHLLNLALPPERRLSLPEPNWLQEWVIDQQRRERARRIEELRRMRERLSQ